MVDKMTGVTFGKCGGHNISMGDKKIDFKCPSCGSDNVSLNGLTIINGVVKTGGGECLDCSHVSNES